MAVDKGIKLFVVWLGCALAFGLFLGWAEMSRGRLDDPDPAYQRPGFLTEIKPAPPITDEIPREGKKTLVLFARSVKGEQLFHDLADQADLAQIGDVVLVTQDGSQPTVANGLTVVAPDPGGSIARAYGLRQLAGGGYPVGYAVVDSQGQIRYATLDPMFGHLAAEVKTIFRAAP